MHSAGITVGLIKDIPSCEVLVTRMVHEAETEINRLGSLIGSEPGSAGKTKRESKL